MCGWTDWLWIVSKNQYDKRSFINHFIKTINMNGLTLNNSDLEALNLLRLIMYLHSLKEQKSKNYKKLK